MYALRDINLRRNPFPPGADPRAFDTVITHPDYKKRLDEIFRRKIKPSPSATKPKFDRGTKEEISKPRKWR